MLSFPCLFPQSSSPSSQSHLILPCVVVLHGSARSQLPHSLIITSESTSNFFLQNLSACDNNPHTKQKSPKSSFLHCIKNSVSSFLQIYFFLFTYFPTSTFILIRINSLHMLVLLFGSYNKNAQKKFPNCLPTDLDIKL